MNVTDMLQMSALARWKNNLVFAVFKCTISQSQTHSEEAPNCVTVFPCTGV